MKQDQYDVPMRFKKFNVVMTVRRDWYDNVGYSEWYVCGMAPFLCKTDEEWNHIVDKTMSRFTRVFLPAELRG
jgi:hypothetical protein